VKIVITVADRFLGFLPPLYNPNTYLPFHIPGLGIILTVAVIFLVGLVTANFVGKRVVHGIELLFARIPLVRTIYTGAKEVVQTFIHDRPAQFRQVVLIEYPRKGIYGIAFVTSHNPQPNFRFLYPGFQERDHPPEHQHRRCL
jgi:uncharacterized membrane protein